MGSEAETQCARLGRDVARVTVGSVVVVSATTPYPLDSGKKVVLAGLLDYWSDRVGPGSVHYVHVCPPGTDPVALAVQVHPIRGPRPAEQAFSLVRRTALAGHSLQESMLYAPRVKRAIAEVLAHIDADVEIYDTVRMGQYAEEIPAAPRRRRVLYMDDLFSVRYARILETLRTQPGARLSPLGEFRHVLPPGADRVASLVCLQRGLLQVERRLIARRERASVHHFERSLLVSSTETARLASETGSTTIRTLPPIVDPSRNARSYELPPKFVLLGLLSLPHNHDAVMTFLRVCMPEVHRQLPHCEILIVGRGASAEVHDAAAPYEGQVMIAGYVPDLARLLSTSCALLAPLRFGSGVKIKILEALAHGVPVLSTPVGAEGIAVGAEGGVLVEPVLARFPEQMKRIAEPAYNRMLSENASGHHAAVYSRAAAFRRYDEIFDERS